MNAEVNAPTKLEEVIERHTRKTRYAFAPSPAFYAEVGMSHIRFGKLRRGTATITGQEAQRLANFFGVATDDLI